jgi:hypothetical protein
MSTELPKAIAEYLATEKAKDPTTQSMCFANDAVVHDEGRDYRGRDAIRAWKQDAQAKYQYEMEPLNASTRENNVVLRARLSGNFPGSPVELDYTFTLANDKIASLVID